MWSKWGLTTNVPNDRRGERRDERLCIVASSRPPITLPTTEGTPPQRRGGARATRGTGRANTRASTGHARVEAAAIAQGRVRPSRGFPRRPRPRSSVSFRYTNTSRADMHTESASHT